MKTNFQKVKDFHEVFGQEVSAEFDPELLNNEKLVNLRLSLIEEEFNELKEAIAKKDRLEVIDALADILYVVYGAGVSFGVDLDKAFDLVHNSNMSKACDTEKQAQDTVDSYTDSRYDSPQYRRSNDKFVVFNKSTGKVLKNIKYKQVDLSSLLK